MRILRSNIHIPLESTCPPIHTLYEFAILLHQCACPHVVRIRDSASPMHLSTRRTNSRFHFIRIPIHTSYEFASLPQIQAIPHLVRVYLSSSRRLVRIPNHKVAIPIHIYTISRLVRIPDSTATSLPYAQTNSQPNPKPVPNISSTRPNFNSKQILTNSTTQLYQLPQKRRRTQICSIRPKNQIKVKKSLAIKFNSAIFTI